MNARVHELLNQQINKELYSAYLYLVFSNYFKNYRVSTSELTLWGSVILIPKPNKNITKKITGQHH